MNIFTEIGKLWRKHREVQHTHHGEDLQLRGTWGEVGTTSLAHSKTDNATWICFKFTEIWIERTMTRKTLWASSLITQLE